MTTDVIDQVTTLGDLASEGAPMHNDICEKAVTALPYLDEYGLLLVSPLHERRDQVLGEERNWPSWPVHPWSKTPALI